MGKITSIQLQQKNKDKYNIFIDDNFKFSVFENTLIHFNLKKGMVVSNEQQLAITKYDLVEKLYAKALQFIAFKMRTKHEFYTKLQNLIQDHTEYHDIIIEDILCKLTEQQLIDDSHYIELFIAENNLTKRKGYKSVIFDLTQKGIDKQLILEHAKFPLKTEYENALFLAQNFLKQKQSLPYRQKKEKLYTYLLQKGFTAAIAKKIIEQLQLEPNEDDEKRLLEKIGAPIFKKYVRLYNKKVLQFKLKEALYKKGFAMHLINTYITEKMEEFIES